MVRHYHYLIFLFEVFIFHVDVHASWFFCGFSCGFWGGFFVSLVFVAFVSLVFFFFTEMLGFQLICVNN